MKKIVIIFFVLTNIASYPFYNTLSKEKNNFGNCGTFIRESTESETNNLVLAASKTASPTPRDHLLREVQHNDAEIADVDKAPQNPYRADYYFLKTSNSKIPGDVLVLSIFKPPKNS